MIDDLENLKCLANYNIKKINLEGNPITTNLPNYREELFKLIPSLTSIDGIDKDGNKVESTLYGEDEEEEEDDDVNYEEAEEDGEFSDEDEDGEDNQKNNNISQKKDEKSKEEENSDNTKKPNFVKIKFNTIDKNKAGNSPIKDNPALQEKLKKIFMKRDKLKFQYMKQDIPDSLKYHSDDSDSSDPS